MRVYPDVSYPGFIITNNGRFVRLATNFSLVVESDGNWMASVKIPPSLNSKMGGICADANNDPGNDLRTKDGSDVSASPYKFSLVGNSWQVDDPEQPE